MSRRLKAVSFRQPEETSPRMRPLSRLPVFLSLEGKRVLVCGEAAAAAWKAELLSAATPDPAKMKETMLRYGLIPAAPS